MRVVVDLRTDAEVELEGPGPLVADERVEIRHRSLYPEKGQLTDVMISRADGENPAVQYYLAYLRDRPDSIVGALDGHRDRRRARCSCTARPARTARGVVVADGARRGRGRAVERDAIVADYVATGERITAIMDRLRASETYRRDLEGIDRRPAHAARRVPRARARGARRAHGGAGGLARASDRAAHPRSSLRERAASDQREHPARGARAVDELQRRDDDDRARAAAAPRGSRAA